MKLRGIQWIVCPISSSCGKMPVTCSWGLSLRWRLLPWTLQRIWPLQLGEGWFRLADCSLGMWIYNQSGWLVVGDVRSFWLGSEVADFRFKFSSWFLWVMVEQCRTFIQVLQTARLARSSAGVINWLIHIYIWLYICNTIATLCITHISCKWFNTCCHVQFWSVKAIFLPGTNPLKTHQELDG